MTPRGWVRRSSRCPGDEVLEKRKKARLALAGYRRQREDFKAGKLLDSMSEDSEFSPKAACDNRKSNNAAQSGPIKKRKRSTIEDGR